jgi:hypothetical protein
MPLQPQDSPLGAFLKALHEEKIDFLRCSFVVAPQFKSRFGSKLQYFGTSIIVPNAVRFTVNFNSKGLSSKVLSTADDLSTLDCFRLRFAVWSFSEI